MAQSVKIAGALFSNVPSIQVPDQNDVYHGFFDVSDTTAAASDVASGKYFYTAAGVRTAGTASGGGGSGLEYEAGTWTPSEDIAWPTINFVNAHTTRPFCVILADDTGDVAPTNSNIYWTISCWYDLYSNSITTGSKNYYARTQYAYIGYTASGTDVTNLSGSASSPDIGYWVTNTWFKPYTRSTSRYWRANRTYKWIAVWKP